MPHADHADRIESCGDGVLKKNKCLNLLCRKRLRLGEGKSFRKDPELG